MRAKVHQQLPLAPVPIDHEHARELAEMSRVLREAPGIDAVLDRVHSELRGGTRADRGRKGMSAEQAVRVLVAKQLTQSSYEKLAFLLADSSTYRSFCLLGIGEGAWKTSTLKENLKRIRPETVEELNRCLLETAKTDGVEDGRKVRGDCTVVETNIHPPSDSSLLNDCVRVLTRLMNQATEATGRLETPYSNHTRRARRRAFGIANARGEKKRKKLYRDLLCVARKAVAYAVAVVAELQRWSPPAWEVGDLLTVMGIESELRRYVSLARRVIEQTERRVLHGERVPASEKLFSIFETHTDIIVKGGRQPEFGHKVFLSTGRSGMVLDAFVLDGNPADATLVERFLDRHEARFGRPPRQLALDGGFTSKENLQRAKERGVEDAVFHKKRSLEIDDMARSAWVYRQLVRFRSGVEAGISLMKRCLGWTRCTWRGIQSFVAYVQASVAAHNLLVLARHRLARAG